MKYLILVCAICVALGCGADRVTIPNLGPPFVDGVITTVDSAQRYAVAPNSGSSAAPSVHFRVSAATAVSRTNGVAASVDNLKPGLTVSVWAIEPVSQTEPTEIVARAVLIYSP